MDRDYSKSLGHERKIGPVDLSKNENDWVCPKEYYISKWIPADILSVGMTSFSNWFLNYDVINSVILPKFNFFEEIRKIKIFIFDWLKTANLRSNFCNHRC